MPLMVPQPDRPVTIPAGNFLHQSTPLLNVREIATSIALARSVISHRLDPNDPDVALVASILAGVAEVLGEYGLRQ